MKPAEIATLASKIQLVIREEEMSTYLETFAELEKLLAPFKKLKISKRVKPMTRIDAGYLTLTDLKKISKKYTNQRINEKTLKHNAETTPDNFILFKKVK